MGIGKPLHLRLFLEGQEVPVISSQVAINLNAPAAASIQVVPLDEILRLKPRTMVHLFFLEDPKVQQMYGPGDGGSYAGLVESMRDRHYKLLYAGEFIGFSFLKQPMSRAVVLQCLDFSSYWDTAQATTMEFTAGGNIFTSKENFFGSDSGIFDDILSHQPEKLVGWMNSKPHTKGLQNIGGLAGGIIRMMEAMGGVSSDHQKGVNDFFTIAELRCRLLEQVTADENDDASKNLLSASVFNEWLLNGLQNIGQQVSLRDMFKLLCQYIYYDVVPNPAAKLDYAQGSKATTTKETTTAIGSSADGLRALSILNDIYNGAIARKGEDQKDIATLKQQASQYADDLDKKASPILKKFAKAGMEVINAYTPAINSLRAITAQSQSSVRAWQSIEDSVAKAVDILKNKDTRVKVPASTKIMAETARLHTQILRPDCFMAPPPRCNVVFPEQYSSLTYDRTHIGEVTRILVLMYNTLVGSGDSTTELLADKNYAPNLTEAAKALVKKVGGSGPYRLLMPHELHTGIVPRVEWLPDTMAFHKKIVGEEATKLRGMRLSWVQKTAMHHFFKYRIGSRQAQVAGRFNPYMVCGFPAVVITRPFYMDSHGEYDNQQILEFIHDTKKASELGMPPQLLGMVVGLNHSVAQDGGQTSFVMTHVRSHLGIDDEFVGEVLDSIKTSKSKRRIHYLLDYDQLVDTEGSVTSLAMLKGVTPQGLSADGKKSTTKRTVTSSIVEHPKTVIENGRKVTTNTTTTVSSTQEEQVDNTPTPYVMKGRIADLPDTVFVPSSPGTKSTGSNGLYGKIVGVQVLAPFSIQRVGGSDYYDRVLIYEDVEVSFGADVPVEDVVRPTWLGTSYDNENVGKMIYQPFFGCDSVVDGLEVSGLTGGTVTTETVSPRPPPEGTSVNPRDETAALKARLTNESASRALLSIERAINTLSYTYGLVRSQKLDVDEFISSYTRRPLATKLDILGSSDLTARVNGNKVEIVTGQGGFHTMAVLPEACRAGNLTGLLDDPDLSFTRIDGAGAKESIPPAYDVRGEKLERVMEYKAALASGSRGFSG